MAAVAGQATLDRPGLAARAQVAAAAALLSAGAAAIHAAVAGPHYREYVPFGLLFVATALGQAAWSALVLTAPSRRLLAVGAVGNAGVVGVWLASRTTGLPFGPHAWQPEAVTALDLAATGFEGGVVLACGALLLAGRPERPMSAAARKRFAAVGAAAVAALCAAFAGASGPAHEHAVPENEPSTAHAPAGERGHASHDAVPHAHPEP